jgi:hypothetical protein
MKRKGTARSGLPEKKIDVSAIHKNVEAPVISVDVNISYLTK